MEEQLLTIKIHVYEKARRKQLRERWHKRALAAAGALNLKLARPSRFGHGKYMTVAVGVEDWRRPGPDGLLDLTQTTSHLKRAAALVAHIAAAERSANKGSD